LSSATFGSLITAFDGSAIGTGGTVTMPAPSRRRAELAVRVEPVRRVALVALRAERVLRSPADGVVACDAVDAAGLAATDEAPAFVPQVSQYPSRIDPPHPA
jgi:hypothetical protein